MEQMKQNEPLANYCTFQIGGPADFFVRVDSTEKLIQAIEWAKAKNTPYILFGGGSNILFDDKGFRGLVIKNEAKSISINDDEITADSGVMVSQLIKFALEHGLSGIEKWSGLPGTVGGAVRGNAGCNGLETVEILKETTILDPSTGEKIILKNEDLKYSYRESILKESDKIVLSATFKLQKAELPQDEQKKIMQEINMWRLQKQPIGRSSGSFFKNPTPDKPAGMLIDQAGLKGKKVGNAQISEKHGNFFLNLGGATAAEMIELAISAKQAVKAKFNTDLHEEVQIFDEFGRKSL